MSDRAGSVHVDKGNFVEWNEEMCVKHDPDLQHNHPNRLMRLLESMRTGCVLKYLDVDEPDAVLDVGCGCGNVLEKIVKGRLYGIEISEYAIKRAEKRLQGSRLPRISEAEGGRTMIEGLTPEETLVVVDIQKDLLEKHLNHRQLAYLAREMIWTLRKMIDYKEAEP